MSDDAGEAALRRSIELLGKYGHLTLDETMERMELLDAEIERLRHDIDRHITIASDLATEVERLRAELVEERHTVLELQRELFGPLPSGNKTRMEKALKAAEDIVREESERLSDCSPKFVAEVILERIAASKGE